MANQTIPQPQTSASRSMKPLWITLLIVVLLAAGAFAYYYFYWRDDGAGTVLPENTNVHSTQTNSAPVVTDPENTNTTLDDESEGSDEIVGTVETDNEYVNAEFGYTVLYGPQTENLIEASSSVQGNLYHEWSLSNDQGRVFAVQVFQSAAKAQEFADRGYVEQTEQTSLGVSNSLSFTVLHIDGLKKGYVLDRGAYTFVLLTDFAPDTQSGQDFQEIAKSFSF